MLMAEPTEDGAEYRAALDALVRALRTAGWERIDSGSEWWAERFVWRRDEPPPEHVEAEPVRTDSVDSRP
jgi:Tfp pilus assembly protein PilW